MTEPTAPAPAICTFHESTSPTGQKQWTCQRCGFTARTSHRPRRMCGPARAPRQPATKPQPAGTCRHLGEIVRQQTCKPCQARGLTQIDVHACAMHGECTTFKTSIHPAIKACTTCPDWTPSPATTRTRRPTIVLLTPSLYAGGAERWMIALARHLNADSRATILTNPEITHPEIEKEITRYTNQVIPWTTTQNKARAAKLIESVDFVLTWGISNLAPFIPDRSRRRSQVIWTAHSAAPSTGKLATIAAPHVDHWAGVADEARKSLPPDLAPRMTTLHNGAEIERTVPLRGREETRRALNIHPDEILIGYIGRLSQEKRPTALAEALAHLPNQYRGIMIGDGRHATETRAESERLAPGRIIYTGHQTHVGDYLAAMDAWLNASPAEGFCLSLIEAWHAGCPTISTPTGALPELEAQHGTLSESITIGATGPEIAETIRWTTNLPRDNTHATRARALAWQTLTAPAMAHRWQKYLLSLLT